MATSKIERRAVAAAAALVLISTAALADRILTDPESGRRLLLRDDGTYSILPPDGGAGTGAGAGSGTSGGAVQSGVPSSRPSTSGSAQRDAGRPSTGNAGSAARTGQYSDVAFEAVSRVGRGELVAIEGWIGNLGTGSQFLMFRDRTVSPPYVVVRMSQDAVAGSSVGASAGGALSDAKASQNWAAGLNDRCRETCAARVEGEVVPAPPGGAPEIIAHHVEVDP